MAEDKKRYPKSLYSGHHQGTLPLLRQCADEKEEGDFMAIEIKRLIAHSGGILKYSDFAVLRFALQCSFARHRDISATRGHSAQGSQGHKFFERMEVKDLLAYLQLVDNPNFTPAFQRAINTPPRAIGDKSLTELVALANTHKISPMEAVEGIVSGRLSDIKPTAKRKLVPFVSVMRRLRKDAAVGVAPDELLRILVDQVQYAEHLRRSKEDHESRMENVQELISFAAQEHSAIASAWSITQDEATAAPDEEEETPLRLFLLASMLASDADGDHGEEGPKDEVIISTCHAAKGLEWPVVFIPAVAAGIFPHSRTEDFDEERRLLYVACTRAKAYLFLSHSEKRPQAPKCDLSPFIATVKNRQMIFTDQIPSVDQPAVRQLSLLLRREEPQKEVWLRMIEEHTAVIAARTTQAQITPPPEMGQSEHSAQNPCLMSCRSDLTVQCLIFQLSTRHRSRPRLVLVFRPSQQVRMSEAASR
ncbi:P-loop containing nucleoside triphosphate hydrolase protein [Auriculariales sp. MPI-PUGE-AT-0066]|nr:P-loop containing nucleoside triphosphate hydrolase protein [Auriculariales sp. MPI-PUGE-AT-0066]